MQLIDMQDLQMLYLNIFAGPRACMAFKIFADTGATEWCITRNILVHTSGLIYTW